MELWNGVISMPSPGMATADAFDGKPKSFNQAMLSKCIKGIIRAGGCKPAFRTNYRRNDILVKFYQ